MKLDAIIIKDTKTKSFTGFISQYPGVCTQANSVDQLKKNLDKNLRLYFDYVRKSDLQLNTDHITSL
ncbi:MAG: hypothetical protein WBF67_02845 [Olleya sp.]